MVWQWNSRCSHFTPTPCGSLTFVPAHIILCGANRIRWIKIYTLIAITHRECLQSMLKQFLKSAILRTSFTLYPPSAGVCIWPYPLPRLCRRPFRAAPFLHHNWSWKSSDQLDRIHRLRLSNVLLSVPLILMRLNFSSVKTNLSISIMGDVAFVFLGHWK